ncbi:hypothetical protein GGH96_001760 [Coemansia sp. RSA 1972]|nr:hypothetical protein GGH96_001760 [Coemansia sp. RSA 1972]
MVQNPDSQPPPNNDAPNAASDALAEKKDDKAAPVRKRLSLACTTCRQRKVKCDGNRPSCRTCAKFNWPCIYQPSNRKRGPRPRALALMDGSMPYSGRSHWPGGHYFSYGIPGQSQMSPPMSMPPPPAIHQLMPHMPGQQFMDVQTNGVAVHANVAHGNVAPYNYDAYSTYSDYMTSTGGIRIRPPAPPRPAMSMHSPPFNPAQPTHIPGGPARYRSGSHYQHQQHPPQHPHQHRMSVPEMSLVPQPYAQAQSQSLAPAHRAQSPFSPYSHRAAPGYSNSGASSHHPAQHASHMQFSPAAPERMRMPAAVPEFAKAEPELAKTHQSAISPGSTAPQHMHPSAQPYTSAYAYAQDMHASTDASRHTPAIYARRETDVTSSRSSSSSNVDAGRRLSQHTPPLLPMDPPPLSSPVPLHAEYTRAAADQAMTAPIPSTAAFSSHKLSSDSAHEYRPYAVSSAKYVEPASAPALPFSEGGSRPRLPPLSEVLGKDYQLILSPNGDGPSRTEASSQFGAQTPLRKDAFSSDSSRVAFETTR